METLETIQSQLQRHLSTQRLTNVTLEFRQLSTGAQRVLFAYDLLKDSNLFPEYIRVEKCDEKSEERRKYGNHVFQRLRKFGEAVKHYNKAVAYAKTREILALAYGNRSAVFFQIKMYKNCLIDIKNALELRPSDPLKEREKRALLALESGSLEREMYFLEAPNVAEKNPIIESASNSVKIENFEKMGRNVCATRDIRPGDVIATERPFTQILLYEFYLTHCHECLTPSPNLIPCENCPLTLYCSERCRETAFAKYHRYECSILDTLHSINATKLQLLALRVVLRHGPIPPEADYTLRDVYTSGNYPEIHHLVTNESARSVSDLFARATVAATLLYLLEKTDFLAENTDLGGRESCADLLFRHLQTAPSNMHEISEIRGLENQTFEITEIGAGAYSFLSLLNHSCSPNVVRHCHGTEMVLRAVKSIKCGEQLFDNYGYHFALMEKTERKSHLKEQYLFDCECEACVNNFPLYSELSKGHNNFIVDESDLNDLLCAKRSTALKLLPALVENATNFEMNPQENRVEILDNQEVMKQCFAILGNKNTLY